jgi:hypothetical protein
MLTELMKYYIVRVFNSMKVLKRKSRKVMLFQREPSAAESGSSLSFFEMRLGAPG